MVKEEEEEKAKKEKEKEKGKSEKMPHHYSKAKKEQKVGNINRDDNGDLGILKN